MNDVLESQAISDIEQDVSDVKETLSQKYTKPSTGIPASDLGSGVIPDESGKADKVNGATSGNFASLDANGNLTDSGHKHSDYLTEAPVTDVQVNGASVLNQGVAEIPVASESVSGTVKINPRDGIDISNGALIISRSLHDQIRPGTNGYKPIVPLFQHESTFYGLAKAAGDTTQASSSNTVGTYTPEALKAIRKMLGIPNMEWEKIADVTVTEDSTEIMAQTDTNGLPFKLRKLVALFSAGTPTTGTRDSFYTQVTCFHTGTNGSSATSTPSLTYLTANNPMIARIEIETAQNEPLKTLAVVGTSEGNTQNAIMMPKIITIYKYIEGFKIYQSATTKSLIPSGSRLTIFGIRYDD